MPQKINSTSMTPVLGLEELQQRIDRSPFNLWLGLRASAMTSSGITVQMTVRDELVGNPNTGVLHGGVMGCLIDAAGSYAIIARTGRSVTTLDYRVGFHRAQRGKQLLANVEILQLGQRVASVDVRVTELDGRLVASGQAVYMNTE